jgi:hypothetical protein
VTENCKPSVALFILKQVLRKALLSEASLRMLQLKDKLEEESTQKSCERLSVLNSGQIESK